jgi:hypothetical protein
MLDPKLDLVLEVKNAVKDIVRPIDKVETQVVVK